MIFCTQMVNFCRPGHIYYVHLFHCLAQLMHMMIYSLDLLTIFQAQIVRWRFASMWNCEVIAQLWSSGEKKQGSYTVFLILNCTHWHAWEVCAGLYQLGITFAWVLIFNCNAEITLTLQGSGNARLSFWRRSLYGI